MERHIGSKCHIIALEMAAGESSGSKSLPSSSGTATKQLRIETVNEKSNRECYRRMMVSAYELAINPTMSLNTFKVIINIQRRNKLKFISGKFFFTIHTYHPFHACCKMVTHTETIL